MKSRLLVLLSVTLLSWCCKTVSETSPNFSRMSDNLIARLLKQEPDKFDSIVSNPAFRVQVIYTQIDRRGNNKPVFTDHFFKVDDKLYFYPASTVKFPVAVLALQRLNELGITGLGKYSTMITGTTEPWQTAADADSSALSNKPSIAHYIKKILLVSDNDAFNRLYEFLGQEYINRTLHKMGYTDVSLVHRLSISLTTDQNRITNPVSFFDKNGNLLYQQGKQESSWQIKPGDTKLGKGFMRNGELINEPFDFSFKNRISLQSLHRMMRAVLFPASVPAEQRFQLSKDDYRFLHKYMSMFPSESDDPVYGQPEFHDASAKFILFGADKKQVDEGVRIFNKIGGAYGFLTDITYVVDHLNNIEFMLSATIHCNSDGVYNDDNYDYTSVGYPFLKNLGRIIYEHELTRKRKHTPDLSSFKINYSE